MIEESERELSHDNYDMENIEEEQKRGKIIRYRDGRYYQIKIYA